MDLYTLLNEFIGSLEEEIELKKEKNKKTPLIIENGIVNSVLADAKIYQFDNFNGNAMPETPATIEIVDINSHNTQKYDASVVSVENNVLYLLVLSTDTPDIIQRAKLIIDNIQILEKTKNVINKIQKSEYNPPRLLADSAFGIRDIFTGKQNVSNFPDDTFNESQKEAVMHSLGSDVTFIWGPPGTGKSKTLGYISELLYKSNNTILITAHTNEAVDGLMEKVIGLFTDDQILEGRIVRWKVTQSKNLVKITPAAIISKRNEELLRKKENYEILKNNSGLSLKQNQLTYEAYKEKYDILIILDNKMVLSHQTYINSVELWSSKSNELFSIRSLIKSKENLLESINGANVIIKFIYKNKKKILTNELSNLKNKVLILEKLINELSVDISNTKTLYDINENNYESYLAQLQFENITLDSMTRLYNDIESDRTAIETYQSEISRIDKLLDASQNDQLSLIKSAQIIGTTLTSCTLNQQLRERTFDTVIVDEVSMAPCPNLFVSCSLASSKLILCGDFYQLSPIAESKKSKWLTLSIFDNIGITDTVAHGKELPFLSMLKNQYRCHPNIANSIIDIVYKGRLENGLESNDKNFYAYKMEPYSNYSCILIDTSNVSTQADPWCEQKGSSWINEKSADLSLKLMKEGLRSGIKSIGIITPYNAQAKLIRSKLTNIRNEYPDRKIEAATVHKYQGREMDMIIFDLPDGPSKYGLAPFLVGLHGSEAMRLINVATTRAKGKLIVVANVDFICQKLYTQKNYRDQILYQWIQYLKSQKHVMYDL